LLAFRFSSVLVGRGCVGHRGCLIFSNVAHLARPAALPAAGGLSRGLERLRWLSAATRSCALSKLRVSLETQGENTTAWIGVSLHNRGPACTLTRVDRVFLEIEVRGRRAHVAGNPLTLGARGRVGKGDTRLLISDWSNWCGSRRAIVVVARVGAATDRAGFSVLPACLQADRSSRLVAIP
jgi:hypothetical protein